MTRNLWPEDAGRAAYLAGFHAVQGLLFETTDKVFRTHKGVQGEFPEITCIIEAESAKLAPMRRDEILQKLRAAEPALRAQGVARAALFGSVARGDNRPDSDIDIMVELAANANVSLFDYVGIVQYLETLFPESVDVANRAGLKPLVRPSAERDAVYAF